MCLDLICSQWKSKSLLERSVSSSGSSLSLLNVSSTWKSWLFMASRGTKMSTRSSSSSERGRRLWRRWWLICFEMTNADKAKILPFATVKWASRVIKHIYYKFPHPPFCTPWSFRKAVDVSCADPFDLDSVVWGSSWLRAPMLNNECLHLCLEYLQVFMSISSGLRLAKTYRALKLLLPGRLKLRLGTFHLYYVVCCYICFFFNILLYGWLIVHFGFVTKATDPLSFGFVVLQICYMVLLVKLGWSNVLDQHVALFGVFV